MTTSHSIRWGSRYKSGRLLSLVMNGEVEITANEPGPNTIYFGATMKRSDKEILNDIARVDNDLSPENLTHDGELPASQVLRRQTALFNERARLVTELGRNPTWQEIYGS